MEIVESSEWCAVFFKFYKSMCGFFVLCPVRKQKWVTCVTKNVFNNRDPSYETLVIFFLDIDLH